MPAHVLGQLSPLPSPDDRDRCWKLVRAVAVMNPRCHTRDTALIHLQALDHDRVREACAKARELSCYCPRVEAVTQDHLVKSYPPELMDLENAWATVVRNCAELLMMHARPLEAAPREPIRKQQLSQVLLSLMMYDALARYHNGSEEEKKDVEPQPE